MEGGAERAQRFPRKTQAGAGIGKADRALSGGRGSNASRRGAFVLRSRTTALGAARGCALSLDCAEHGLCGGRCCPCAETETPSRA